MNGINKQTPVVKKPRKPRTKKIDMIKKKEEQAKLKESQPPKKRGRKPKGGKIMKTHINPFKSINVVTSTYGSISVQ